MENTYIIFLSLLFSALFSGIEIAYFSANKLKIELAGKKGKLTGRILSSFNQIPSYFIGALLVGNNIALVIYGIAMAKMLEPWITYFFPVLNGFYFVVLLIQTLISTLLILIAGEFIPKLLFRINPNRILNIFAIPMGFIFVVLSPVVGFIILISKVLLRIFFRIRIEENKPVFSRLDLEAFVKEQNTGLSSQMDINEELFENALYLIQVKVKECMVPRTEISGIDIQSSIKELKARFIEKRHSRLLVYDDTIDNILGYVHHHDLLKRPINIQSILFTIPVIPETMPAMDVLNLFTKKRKTIACVVDEFGGTAGIVTIEDILEEIFGEIEDEHDTDEFIEKKISDTEFVFSARLEIDYINENYGLNIPLGEYETLGGFILDQVETIPRIKEQFILGNYEILILNSSETKIETVRLKALSK